jgi:hypothetical protein
MRRVLILVLISAVAPGSVIPSAAGTGSTRAIHAASPHAPLVDDYEVVLLAVPEPLTDSAGYGVGAGQVAGAGRIAGPESPDETHAVYWPEGSITGIDLHPTNFLSSEALGTNGQQQVGSASGPRTGFARHAWVWNGDAIGSDDLHPAGMWNDSIARAIAGNQQVGNVNYFDQETTIIHAALWYGSAASAVDLHPPIADCDRSYAEDTDGVRQVGYGYFVTPDNLAPYRALLWEGSAASAVILHPPDFTHSFAEGVSGDEQVGFAFDTLEGDGYTRALLWHGSAESVISLHSDGYLATTAYATNGIQQVGYGETAAFPSAAHALRWSGTAGSVFDLHSLLPEEFSEGSSIAYDIDTEGNVAGVARRPDGSSVAVLWRALVTPTPTPTPTREPTPTPTPLPGVPVVSAVGPTSGPAAGGTTVTVTGTNFLSGAAVNFGSVPASSVSISATELSVSSPPLTAGALYDVTVVNPGGSSATLPRGWFADFDDVPQSDPFHADIETLYRSAVSAGCGGGNYCPAAAVTRSQMAVFLLKAKHGALYAPPPATGAIFADVPVNAFAAAWIEQLFAEGITGGCGGGNYCPDAVVTRAQMAVMLLTAKHGPAYAPPSCTGVFVDVPCGPAPAFAVDWIEELAAEGITAGCGGNAYCPDSATRRGSMATFLVRTFALQTPQD